MGSERFRLSEMMVNSWFNKLKDTRRTDGRRSMAHDGGKQGHLASAMLKAPPEQQKQEGSYLIPNRASYYYSSRERTVKLPRSPVDTKAWDPIFPAESLRTSDQRPQRGHPKASARQASPAGTAICNCHSSSGSVRKCGGVPESSACGDFSSSVSSVFEKLEGFEAMSEFKLRPILTRPSKKEVHDKELSCTETRRTTPRRKLMRIKVRPRYPRTTAKRSLISCRVEATAPRFAAQKQQPKAISESLIVVVLSLDPQRDFRESMLEMIVANEITRPKDLQELLACYLSLNSEEHHETIIRVFKQIWFDLMLI